jgi:dipeptidyl aminopeptidase/acylaminoacyl peptidase
LRFWFCLFAALAAVSSARAAPPPVEVYGRLPAIDFVSLAPSGERFALAARDGENRLLFVRKLDGQAEFATRLQPGKVRGIVWGGDRHLFVFGSATIVRELAAFDRQEWMGGAHLDLKTGKAFPLLGSSNTFMHAFFGWYGAREVDGHAYAYLGAITQEEMSPKLVTEYRSPTLIYPKLVRIDLETGKADFVVKAVTGSTQWVLDGAGQVVARSVVDPRGRTFSLFSGPSGGTPVQVSRITEGVSGVDLEGLGRTAGSLLISELTGEDVLLKEIPITGGEGEVLIRGDNTAEGMYDRETRLLIGVSSDSGAQIKMFDPVVQKKIDASRKAFPGLHTALVSYSRGFEKMVWLTTGEGDSGTYWLVDISKRSAVPIGRVNPDIPGDAVGPVKMVSYKASDGLAMDGVLTLPPGREAKNLPLVVLPHGGPLVPGDEAVFDWWAQAFASRGYAVFQPNYRGTEGKGEAFRRAAFGEFGRKMQTDITDGVSTLAAQGVVDPRRACIVGASYGGYAALAGVTVQQGQYRCAVAVAGLGDLARFQYWVRQGHATDQRAESFWRALMGASAGQNLQDISPAQLASRADAPILLIHGLDDSVVPIEQSQQMEKALKAAGKPVEFITMAGEDHWLSREITRQAMLKSAVAFVEKNNPPN